MSHTQNFNTYNIEKPSKQPPPLSQLYAAYKADPANEHLRFGQWVYNRFLGSVHGDKRELIDQLHATHSKEVALSLIEGLYKDYQWPL